jgi:competence ComEA-like helix-hairpin-helix protein
MPTESSSPRSERAAPSKAAAGSEPAAGDSAGRRRSRNRRFAILGALVIYLCIAFWMKPGAAGRVSDSLADLRDSVSDRFHKHPDHAIDLNAATAAELQQLPGIGPSMAAQILSLREQSGPFHQPEDLLAIPRMTRRSLNRIRPYIFVGMHR